MRKIFILAASALLATAAPVAAGIRVGFVGGYALTPDANQGQGLAVGVHFALDVTPNLALQISALRYQTPVTASGAGLSQGTLAVLPIEISLKVHFPLSSRLQLFAAAGAGAYLPHFSPDAAAALVWTKVGFTPAENLDAAFGFHVRGGLELALGSRVGLFFETRYSTASANGTWTLTDNRGGPSVTGKITGLGLDAVIFGLGLTIAL